MPPIFVNGDQGGSGGSTAPYIQHFPIVESGLDYSVSRVGGTMGVLTMTADRMLLAPLQLSADLAISQIAVEVTTGVPTILGRLSIYASDGDGLPSSLIDSSPNLDWSTSSTTPAWTKSYTFQAGTLYWLAAHCSGASIIRTTETLHLAPIGWASGQTQPYTGFRKNSVAFAGGSPNPFTAGTYTIQVSPLFLLRAA